MKLVLRGNNCRSAYNERGRDFAYEGNRLNWGDLEPIRRFTMEGKRLTRQAFKKAVTILQHSLTVVLTLFLGLGAVGQTGAAGSPEPIRQTRQAGYVVMPKSSVERPEDAGVRVHTNYVFRSDDGIKPTVLRNPQALSPVASEVSSDSTIEEVETPASLGCLYLSNPKSRTTGCIPNYASGTGGPSRGGWGVIVLVDAYDNPYAASDLVTFDSYWGLPKANFVKYYANNGDCTAPPANQDWAVEESLDIEWAHVFAPDATIALVEACSNSLVDMLGAEDGAMAVAASLGGGEVSNSWSSAEFPGEVQDDPHFGPVQPYSLRILAFASAGDNGIGATYPSSSPWVVSAGGTSVLRNATNQTFNSEACWGRSGGGGSQYEVLWQDQGQNYGPGEDYQAQQFSPASGATRQTPDLAFDSDPASGVLMYSQYGCGGWCVVGGTSVASPSLAGIVNRANNRLSNAGLLSGFGTAAATNQENVLLYSQLRAEQAYSQNFYDITAGSNGGAVGPGWDYCTGVGSPRGLLGK